MRVIGTHMVHMMSIYLVFLGSPFVRSVLESVRDDKRGVNETWTRTDSSRSDDKLEDAAGAIQAPVSISVAQDPEILSSITPSVFLIVRSVTVLWENWSNSKLWSGRPHSYDTARLQPDEVKRVNILAPSKDAILFWPDRWHHKNSFEVVSIQCSLWYEPNSMSGQDTTRILSLSPRTCPVFESVIFMFASVSTFTFSSI